MGMQGSGHTSSVTEIRAFLRADTAEELVRLQLANNLKFRSKFSYTDFSFVKEKWYCWYLIDIEDFTNGSAG